MIAQPSLPQAQQWFTAQGADIPSQSKHEHLGACVPYNATLSGIVTIDALVQLHNMPDMIFTGVEAVVAGGDGVSSSETIKMRIASTGFVGLDCTNNMITCAAVFRLTLDTSMAPFDGYYMIQLRGSLQLASGLTVPDPSKVCVKAHSTTCLDQLGFSSVLRVKDLTPTSCCRSRPVFPMARQSITQPAKQSSLRIRPCEHRVPCLDSLIFGLSFFEFPHPTPTCSGRGTMKFPWSYTEAFFLSSLPLRPVSGIWTPKIATIQHSKVSFASYDMPYDE